MSCDGALAVQKENRLARREDFNKVYRYGKSVANMQLVLYILPRPQQPQFRLGVSVSKKLGNAVVRNRIRRLLKEIVRHHGDSLPGGIDLILIARKPAVDLTYQELEKCVLHVMKRASLLSKRPVRAEGKS